MTEHRVHRVHASHESAQVVGYQNKLSQEPPQGLPTEVDVGISLEGRAANQLTASPNGWVRSLGLASHSESRPGCKWTHRSRTSAISALRPVLGRVRCGPSRQRSWTFWAPRWRAAIQRLGLKARFGVFPACSAVSKPRTAVDLASKLFVLVLAPFVAVLLSSSPSCFAGFSLSLTAPGPTRLLRFLGSARKCEPSRLSYLRWS